MIILGLGGNLTCETFGSPRTTCGVALQMLEARGIAVTGRSKWYESAPVPISDQPWYVNGIVSVETHLTPESLVKEVFDVETELGRRRTVANAARTIDIDVIAYNDVTIEGTTPDEVAIPHPRMHTRAFVLLPLTEIAPNWQHPNRTESLPELVAALPENQICRPLKDAERLFGTEWNG